MQKNYINQSGTDGIQGFDAILAALPPALREAFAAERRAQAQNLERNLREATAEYGAAYANQYTG